MLYSFAKPDGSALIRAHKFASSSTISWMARWTPSGSSLEQGDFGHPLLALAKREHDLLQRLQPSTSIGKTKVITNITPTNKLITTMKIMKRLNSSKLSSSFSPSFFLPSPSDWTHSTCHKANSRCEVGSLQQDRETLHSHHFSYLTHAGEMMESSNYL